VSAIISDIMSDFVSGITPVSDKNLIF